MEGVLSGSMALPDQTTHARSDTYTHVNHLLGAAESGVAAEVHASILQALCLLIVRSVSEQIASLDTDLKMPFWDRVWHLQPKCPKHHDCI